ncbi:MAG: FMN-binding protein, partial [Rhodospirillales bacterium]|nr:FMN-binding protein [Rhodospirillales bacterium]
MLPTGWRLWLPFLLSLLLTVTILPPQAAAGELGAYQAGIDPAAVFSGAERFGPIEGTPPAQAAYKDGKVVGYVFVTSDIGYSGKPIRVLAGMDTDGLITGAKVVEHHEPILLVGIPQEKLFDYVGRYVGQRVTDLARTGAGKPPVDIIAGATVTVVVLNDGLIRTAIRIARARGIAGFKPVAAATESVTLAERSFRKADWPSLLGDGAVRRLHLDNADVDQAFTKLGIGSGEPYTVPSIPTNTFIDLYAALVTPESIGRNLLGDNEYEQLRRWLKPGQQALMIFAEGEYSFRGSGYVRGGIFDRFQVIQDDVSILFHDKDYRRIGAIEAEGAPAFPEIGLFRIPQGVVFDPAKPWRMELLAQRPTGPIQKAFTSFSLDYQLPEAYLLRKLVASPAQPAAAQPAPAEGAQALESYADEGPREPLWVGIWRARVVDIAILSISLTTLTLIFFFQDLLVRRPRLFDRLRLGFLAFTLLWIGGYAQAQLSVVNVLT